MYQISRQLLLIQLKIVAFCEKAKANTINHKTAIFWKLSNKQIKNYGTHLLLMQYIRQTCYKKI